MDEFDADVSMHQWSIDAWPYDDNFFHSGIDERSRLEHTLDQMGALVDEASSIAAGRSFVETEPMKSSVSELIQKLSDLDQVLDQQQGIATLGTTYPMVEAGQEGRSGLSGFEPELHQSPSLQAVVSHEHFTDKRAAWPTPQNVELEQQVEEPTGERCVTEELVNWSSGIDGELGKVAHQRQLAKRKISSTSATVTYKGTDGPQGKRTRRQRARPSLSDKVLQIASPAMITAAESFMTRYKSSQSSARIAASASNLLAVDHDLDNLGYLRMLPQLAMMIECSAFGEQEHRIKKRAALAHFYTAYTQAQEHSELFLSWFDTTGLPRTMLPRCNQKSIVQHRFADLVFPPHNTQIAGAGTETEWAAMRINKIQTWRKYGKGWAKFISRFGYAILLMIPPNLTDEDLRAAQDDEIAMALDRLDDRLHVFEGVLQRTNDFFIQNISLHTAGGGFDLDIQ